MHINGDSIRIYYLSISSQFWSLWILLCKAVQKEELVSGFETKRRLQPGQDVPRTRVYSPGIWIWHLLITKNDKTSNIARWWKLVSGDIQGIELSFQSNHQNKLTLNNRVSHIRPLTLEKQSRSMNSNNSPNSIFLTHITFTFINL